jgi:long-subunit acyl-CoA synthetase (AMP-forming)
MPHPAGDALAIAMPLTVEAAVIYFGIVLAGCVVVSIADSFAAAEVATRLRIAGAVAVFTQVPAQEIWSMDVNDPSLKMQLACTTHLLASWGVALHIKCLYTLHIIVRTHTIQSSSLANPTGVVPAVGRPCIIPLPVSANTLLK